MTRSFGTGRAYEHTAVPYHLPKTHKTRDEGTARAYRGTTVWAFSPYNLNFFPSFSLIQTTQPLSSFKVFSLNLHNLNLQTFITFFKLHQITQFLNQNNSKLHPKPNPPIKNNIHPSQPTNHQIRIPFYPNPQTPIFSPIFTQTLKNLT